MLTLESLQNANYMSAQVFYFLLLSPYSFSGLPECSYSSVIPPHLAWDAGVWSWAVLLFRGSVCAPGQTSSCCRMFRDPETQALWEIIWTYPIIGFQSYRVYYKFPWRKLDWKEKQKEAPERKYPGVRVPGSADHGEEQQRFWGKSETAPDHLEAKYHH